MSNIKLVFDKILLQKLKQFRNAGRVACANIIDGLDQTFAQHITPHAIHKTASEVGIARTGQPCTKLRSTRTVCGGWIGTFERKLRINNLLRFLVTNFYVARVGDFFIKRLSPFDGRSTDGSVARRFILFERYLREVRGRFIVLILGPFFERVIVALVAIESNP